MENNILNEERNFLLMLELKNTYAISGIFSIFAFAGIHYF
jgi:hypothetical protein